LIIYRANVIIQYLYIYKLYPSSQRHCEKKSKLLCYCIEVFFLTFNIQCKRKTRLIKIKIDTYDVLTLITFDKNYENYIDSKYNLRNIDTYVHQEIPKNNI